MLPAFLISFREGLEIALVIGLVLGALRKSQSQKLNRLVWFGALCAGVFSLTVAIGLHRVGSSFIIRSSGICAIFYINPAWIKFPKAKFYDQWNTSIYKVG